MRLTLSDAQKTATKLGIRLTEHECTINLKDYVCPACDGKSVCKHSRRSKLIKNIDEYDRPVLVFVEFHILRCVECYCCFTPDTDVCPKHARYGYGVFKKAEELLNSGLTYMGASDVFFSEYHIRVPHTTMHDWVNNEKIRYEGRHRKIARVAGGSEGSAEAAVPLQ